MTRLLFREDAYATTFEAGVLEIEGRRVLLDRTLFYPEAGGQSADAGRLDWAGGAAKVTDVQKGAGGVWHELEGSVPQAGANVRGEINWAARYRHMQRHTGEHLLAQAFLRVNPAFKVRAVSMRGPHCTLDVEGGPADDDARSAEKILREIVALDLPVETFEVPEAGLGQYPLRRPPQVSGTVRLVGVREEGGWWELSACGGTHLKSSAFAAPVAVLSLERVKADLTRVTFVTGEEAAEELGRVYRAARKVARSLSVPVEKLEERFGALQEEQARLRADLERAQLDLARALVLAAPARTLLGGQSARLIRLPQAALVTPALGVIATLPNTLGAVVAEDGRCGAASSAPDWHAGKLLGAWLQAAGGRGGGKADVAQGQTTDTAAFERAVWDGWATL